MKGAGEDDSSAQRLLFHLLASKTHYETMTHVRHRCYDRQVELFDCDLYRVLVYDLRTVARRILIEKIRGWDGLTIPTSESLLLLHGAIITGDMSSLRILLEKKVDVSKTNPWNPVLHRAI